MDPIIILTETAVIIKNKVLVTEQKAFLPYSTRISRTRAVVAEVGKGRDFVAHHVVVVVVVAAEVEISTIMVIKGNDGKVLIKTCHHRTIGIITMMEITMAIITIIHTIITTNKAIIEVKVVGKIVTEVVDISVTTTITMVEIITGVVADADISGAVTVAEMAVETEEVEIGKTIKMAVHQEVAVEIVENKFVNTSNQREVVEMVIDAISFMLGDKILC